MVIIWPVASAALAIAGAVMAVAARRNAVVKHGPLLAVLGFLLIAVGIFGILQMLPTLAVEIAAAISLTIILAILLGRIFPKPES